MAWHAFRQGLRPGLIAVAAALLLPFPALAASTGATGNSPSNPIPLTSPVQGSLAGNSGGSFAYYQFSYPGDGSTVALTLTADNTVPLNTGSAGLNVYQGGALVATSGRYTDNSDLTLFFSHSNDPAIVQVYNYDPANSIDFSVSAQGLPAQTATVAPSATAAPMVMPNATAAPAATTAAVPSASATPAMLALNGSVKGQLIGNTGGSYANYQLTYPGDGSTVSLTLTVDDPTPLTSGAAGFNVYQSGALLTSASQNGQNSAFAFFTSSTGGPITVQVFDYDPMHPITFTLTAQH